MDVLPVELFLVEPTKRQELNVEEGNCSFNTHKNLLSVTKVIP